jgi:hypothetical protein
MSDKIQDQLNRGDSVIELHLTTIDQLFNSFDPSPFHEKDLDADAEFYLIGRARELRRDTSLRLVVNISKPVKGDIRIQHIPEAIQSHFEYRTIQTLQELLELIRTGWISLAIGLIVLGACLMVIHYSGLVTSTNPFSRLSEQSLLLLGWVAMWRPLEIFLYDWWPIWRRLVLLRRLAKMSVKIRFVSRPMTSKSRRRHEGAEDEDLSSSFNSKSRDR